jgi:hypothetical protein
MDPFKPPKSDLNLREVKPPTPSILVIYGLVVLSFILFLVEDLMYASASNGGLLDWKNYIFVPVWAVILFWVTGSIRKRKDNPKYTFLLLAILVFGLSFFDLQGPYPNYFAIGEAACFLFVFVLLSRRETTAWFE